MASFSYSICVTPAGTVLAASGMSIYRSIDNGLHFEKIGPVSSTYLYRLQLMQTQPYLTAIDFNGDTGSSVRQISKLKGSLDDFAYLGDRIVVGGSVF